MKKTLFMLMAIVCAITAVNAQQQQAKKTTSIL